MMKMLYFYLVKYGRILPKHKSLCTGKQKAAKIEKKVQGDFSLFGKTNGFFLQFCNVEIESQSVHLLHCADTPFWSTEGPEKFVHSWTI